MAEKVDRRKLPRSREHIEKFKATMRELRTKMGSQPYGLRGMRTEPSEEINDTWGSPGRRIFPKFDTSNEP